MREKDSTFIKELKQKNRHLSDSDVDELLKRHLAEVESLRRQRNAQSEKLNEKLLSKLAQKRQKYGDDYIVSIPKCTTLC